MPPNTESRSAVFCPPAVLIAEDDENDIALLQRAFLEAGHPFPVRFVRNGLEAIHYLDGRPPYGDRAKYPLPGLMLLDLGMPIKDGFEVLSWIREQEKFNQLPVIVLTSSDICFDVNRAYEIGATAYWLKPANFHRLIEMVNRLKEFSLANAKANGPAMAASSQ
jgi:CheY-like chemotaxis protein